MIRSKALLLATLSLGALSGCSLLSKPEPLEALPEPIKDLAKRPPERPGAALAAPGGGAEVPNPAEAMRRAAPPAGAEGRAAGG